MHIVDEIIGRSDNQKNHKIDIALFREFHYPQGFEGSVGRIKTVGGLGAAAPRVLPKVDWAFTFAATVYNLTGLLKLFVGIPW